MRPSLLSLARGLAGAWLVVALWGQPARKNPRNWPDYGGGADSSHFVNLQQINRENVKQLEVAWVYPSGDQHAYLFNPVVVDGVMYVLARNHSLVALDAATGKEIPACRRAASLTGRARTGRTGASCSLSTTTCSRLTRGRGSRS
jgi:hypothetical protein